MRRVFLLIFSVLLGAVATSEAQEGRRPNVLWISGDDHAPYVMGAYGNRAVRTPNLDRLASQGVRFDRAYCNSPVCTASRQSFLTGRYPRTIGVTQLRTPLPRADVTLAEMLKEVGYATAAIGKMHFNSDLTHGFDVRIDLAEHAAWLRKNGRTAVPAGIEVQPRWRPFDDPARVWLNSAARPVGLVEAEMAGTYFAQQAETFLGAQRRDPFFLMVSFYEPHSPFEFPVEYRGRHQPEGFRVLSVAAGDAWQVPKVFASLTEREKQGIIAAYHTSVEFLDANVGRVLAALEASGQSNDTLVIYTGDHGYMLGQHGRFEKHCGYEPAVRSPLLIRMPGKVEGGRSTPALVEFIDILPTVLENVRVAVPGNVQGKSLMPLLGGRADAHRERVFIEYSENEEAYVVTSRWKMIYCTGNREREDGYTTGKPSPGRTIRLYDLENDPDEMNDVAATHPAVMNDLVGALAAHMKGTARDPASVPATKDPHELLRSCLRPRDVTKEEALAD
jgi:arylsulfatase A-like enzyme